MASERIQRQIDRFLDEAEEAVAKGDWTRVRDCAQKVLAFDPENTDAPAFLTAAERSLDSPKMSPPIASDPTSSTVAEHPPTDQPTSFANGRYQVKRFLGEGGKKREL